MDKIAQAEKQLQDQLFDQVYVGQFKQACAKQGITFETHEDLVAGLETAAYLKMAEAQLREQGIDPRPSMKKQARDMLKQAMFGAPEQPAATDEGVISIKSAMAALIEASKNVETPAQAS